MKLIMAIFLEIADIIKKELGAGSPVMHKPPMRDDPRRRKPDISVAKAFLGWVPKVPLQQGLEKSISYFKDELDCVGKNDGTKCRNNYIENISA